MRTLFEMDAKNYDPAGSRFSRPSARGIILRGDRLALVHALRYDYYKFPGGGIEAGEDPVAALLREVEEEAGLRVLPESLREYGLVRRVEKGHPEDIFVQDNFYYFCGVAAEALPQRLTDTEREEGFSLEWLRPEAALAANLAAARGEHGGSFKYRRMAEREARVLALLIAEGFLPTSAGGPV